MLIRTREEDHIYHRRFSELLLQFTNITSLSWTDPLKVSWDARLENIALMITTMPHLSALKLELQSYQHCKESEFQLANAILGEQSPVCQLKYVHVEVSEAPGYRDGYAYDIFLVVATVLRGTLATVVDLKLKSWPDCRLDDYIPDNLIRLPLYKSEWSPWDVPSLQHLEYYTEAMPYDIRCFELRSFSNVRTLGFILRPEADDLEIRVRLIIFFFFFNL